MAIRKKWRYFQFHYIIKMKFLEADENLVLLNFQVQIINGNY